MPTNIIFYQQKLLLQNSNGILKLPDDKSVKLLTSHLSKIYLSKNTYVAKLKIDLKDNYHDLQLLGLRQILNIFTDDNIINNIIYYRQLIRYYDSHTFCGSCGNKTIKNNNNKFVSCEVCQCEIYPHIAPCIIVRIHHQDKILMAQGINAPKNSWGLIAGFVEIGETLENAVRREVKEEVGIEIDNIKFWGSQSWSFPDNSIMIGFIADYKSGNIVTQPEEIIKAGFYGPDNLPGFPALNYSISSKMIKEFLETAKK